VDESSLYQGKKEGCTRVRTTFVPHLPAVTPDDPIHDSQADADDWEKARALHCSLNWQRFFAWHFLGVIGSEGFVMEQSIAAA